MAWQSVIRNTDTPPPPQEGGLKGEPPTKSIIRSVNVPFRSTKRRRFNLVSRRAGAAALRKTSEWGRVVDGQSSGDLQDFVRWKIEEVVTLWLWSLWTSRQGSCVGSFFWETVDPNRTSRYDHGRKPFRNSTDASGDSNTIRILKKKTERFRTRPKKENHLDWMSKNCNISRV